MAVSAKGVCHRRPTRRASGLNRHQAVLTVRTALRAVVEALRLARTEPRRDHRQAFEQTGIRIRGKDPLLVTLSAAGSRGGLSSR